MRDRLRPLLAALLAFVIPGLGHVLLRKWGRALVWHLTIVIGTAVLLSVYEVDPGDPLADPLAFSEAIPFAVSFPVAMIVTLSALDAYLVGREEIVAENQSGTVTESGEDVAVGTVETTCPHCGKTTDPDLDFCHWCTEPLPDESDPTVEAT